MKIHPLWTVCIIVRLSLIWAIRVLYEAYKNTWVSMFLAGCLLLIGLGFLFKGIFGSNNEIQLNKVFWHEARLVHSAFYLLASYYLYTNNLNMNSLVLFTDVLFSFMYRFLFNK